MVDRKEPSTITMTASATGSRSAVLAASVLWLLVILLWRPAVAAPFVHDDVVHIIDRERQIDAPWASWGQLSSGQRPLVQVTLGINHALGGIDPRGYHALNIGLHGLASALCLIVLCRAAAFLIERGALVMPPSLAFAVCCGAATLWALHPVQTASVSYVIQRAEVLVGLFTFVAILGLMRFVLPGASVAWGVIAPVGCALAILSKPTAVTVPCIVLAVDAAICSGSIVTAWRNRWPMHLACFLPLLLLIPLGVIGPLLAGDGVPRAAGLGLPGIGPLAYAWAEVGAIGIYAAEVVVPTLLSIDHGWTIIEGAAWPRVLGLIVIAAAFVAIVVGLRRNAWWWIVPALSVLALLPSSSFMPLRDPVADHRLYLALLGPVVTFVAVVAWLGWTRSGMARLAAVALIALSIVGAAISTIRRNDAWCHPARLWDGVLALRPDDSGALVNRSLCALAAGDDAAARADALAALSIRPADGPAMAMIGLLDVRAGRHEEALVSLARAEELGIRTASVRGAKGDALRALGRYEEAADAYERASRRSPSSDQLMLLHGLSLAQCGRDAEAMEVLVAVAARSDDERITGRAREAIEECTKRQGSSIDGVRP